MQSEPASCSRVARSGRASGTGRGAAPPSTWAAPRVRLASTVRVELAALRVPVALASCCAAGSRRVGRPRRGLAQRLFVSLRQHLRRAPLAGMPPGAVNARRCRRGLVERRKPVSRETLPALRSRVSHNNLLISRRRVTTKSQPAAFFLFCFFGWRRHVSFAERASTSGAVPAPATLTPVRVN